jgi:hypothetical protein
MEVWVCIPPKSRRKTFVGMGSGNVISAPPVLQGCNGKAFLLKGEHMGSILNVYNVYQKDVDGFVQHLEPWAWVGNDNVVFPPHV